MDWSSSEDQLLEWSDEVEWCQFDANPKKQVFLNNFFRSTKCRVVIYIIIRLIFNRQHTWTLFQISYHTFVANSQIHVIASILGHPTNNNGTFCRNYFRQKISEHRFIVTFGKEKIPNVTIAFQNKSIMQFVKENFYVIMQKFYLLYGTKYEIYKKRFGPFNYVKKGHNSYSYEQRKTKFGLSAI